MTWIRPGALVALLGALALTGCSEGDASTDVETVQGEMVDALTPLFDEYASLTGGEGTVRANEPTDIGCTEGERAQHQIVFSIPGSGDVTIDDAEAVFDNFMTGPHDLDVRDDVDFSGETLTSRYEDGAAFYELVKIVRDGYTMTLLVDVGPAEAGGLTVAVDVFTDCLG